MFIYDIIPHKNKMKQIKKTRSKPLKGFGVAESRREFKKAESRRELKKSESRRKSGRNIAILLKLINFTKLHPYFRKDSMVRWIHSLNSPLERGWGVIKQNQRSKRKLTASVLTLLLILQTIIGVFAPINISVTPPYVSQIEKAQAAGESWYNASWTKRKAITVTENSGSTLTNYQVKITVSYDSDMQADFDDIRFTDSDGSALIDYWLELKTDSTTADF